MRVLSIKMLLAVVAFSFVAIGQSASANLLTFDDLPAGSSGQSLPIGYGGLDWTNMGYVDSSAVPPVGYFNGTVSGPNVAYNLSGNPAAVSDGTFNFVSAYLTAAWNDGLSITVKGLLNSVELYSQTVQVDTSGPTLVNFSYLGVDEVTFESSGGVPNPNYSPYGGGTQFVMDDVTIMVPEPATLALAALGLLGVACCRRRRK